MKRSQRKQKFLPFTDAQIRERAYKLWQERGEGVSSEDNWQAAIESLKQERSPLGKIRQWFLYPFRVLARALQFLWQIPAYLYRVMRLALTVESPKAALALVKVVIAALGVLVASLAVGLLYRTYQQAQHEQQLSIERLATDRFAKATEQLGHQDIHVRIGGIYVLERIAIDSAKDHWTVMEVLAAYIRNQSPLPQAWAETPPEKRQALEPVKTDVQSALAVIGRRRVENDPEYKWVNLSQLNLTYADLRHANLGGADLSGTDLSDANLSDADLRHAYLHHADLRRADLRRADLRNADLRNADLRNADLRRAISSVADLREVDLRNANLDGANLDGTILSRADLSGANLNYANLDGTNFIDAKGITPAQIKQAEFWDSGQYAPNFRQQLGLPPFKAP